VNVLMPVVLVMAAKLTTCPFCQPCAVKLTVSPESVNVQATAEDVPTGLPLTLA